MTDVTEENAKLLGRLALGGAYGSLVIVQAFDVHSTLEAVRRGAVEMNPVMAGLLEHRTALIVTKIGVTAATIYATAHVARHSRWKALLVAGAINSGYLLIARNNYAIANRVRE
jgi:hypothetical protein